MKSLEDAEQEFKEAAKNKESKFQNVARAIKCTTDVVSRLVHSQDLWPKEEVLDREGLLFDRGGTHSQDWNEICKTLRRLKANSSENFSTIDMTKVCRHLNYIAQTSYPSCSKLIRLKNLTLSLNKLINSAKEAINVENDDESRRAILQNVSNSSNRCLLQATRKQICERQRELFSIVDECNNTSFKRVNKSLNDESKILSERLNRIEEILSEVKALRNQVLDCEEEYMNILEESLEQNPDTVSTETKSKTLPLTPTGGRPIHAVVLLGLKNVAVKIIEKYYNTPELLSLPVLNDLNPWRIKRDKHEWDDGMHTGETMLHIAIVQEDVEFTKYLLERGIDLVSRAMGRFFQPKVIPMRIPGRVCTRSEKPGERGDGQVDEDSGYLRIFSRSNEDSACYYGEYPLSFCASVGNCELMEAVCNEMQRRLGAKMAAGSHHAPGLAKMGSKKLSNRSLDFQIHREEDVTSLQDLLRATDSLGNTALHMAAFHERTEAIDWLMSKDEDGMLLDMLNLDGLTPFTLAVRYGKVNIYRHILYTYLSKTAWVYGRMRMRKTDLLQVAVSYRAAMSLSSARLCRPNHRKWADR